MNKEHFNNLVGNYSALENQFKDLEKLMVEYPYSQPVRMLNVKSSSFLSPEEFKQRMAVAAFYTTDRNVLRHLIEKGKVPSDVEEVVKVARKTSTKKKVKPQPPKRSTSPTPESTLDADQLRAEVMANLKLLQETKHEFLKISELEAAPLQKDTAVKSKGGIKSTAKKKPAATPEKQKTASLEKPDASQGRRVNKKDLIDKFIADEPRITPKKVMEDNLSDLSKASSELKEDLVSENLAVIFARQGKTMKAIDIYKKLIWKFPQKKASFAAQIEELKKKKG